MKPDSISGHAPEPPVIHTSGEGKVERISDTSWRIAGRTFRIDQNTIILGHPQVGDWVAFDARVLKDGTSIADRIVLLERAPENPFTFRGPVQAITETQWTIVGRLVQVDKLTEIDPNLQIGDLVEVSGTIAQDGKLWYQAVSEGMARSSSSTSW